MRLIDANALYRLISEWESVVREEVINTKADIPTFVANNMRLNEITRIKHLVADAPTVDAQPVRHDKWIMTADGKVCTCSVCGDEFDNTCNYDIRKDWKCCPVCKCLMDGD